MNSCSVYIVRMNSFKVDCGKYTAADLVASLETGNGINSTDQTCYSTGSIVIQAYLLLVTFRDVHLYP